MSTHTLRAGAAQIDITPQAGTHLAGTVSCYRPAETLLDPIYAKALAIERGERRMCLLCLDVLMLTREYSDLIRRQVAEECGFDEDAVLVHSLQNHSSSSVGHFMISGDAQGISPEYNWLRGGDDSYHDIAVEGAVEAARRACAVLTEVQVGANSGIEGRVTFNRRMVMRDGSIGMPLGGSNIDPRSRYIEGPTDPELGMICLRTPSLRPLAFIMHYTAHPVNVFHRSNVVSADWPGALSNELRRTHGSQCIPLVINGACGNINPWDPYDPDFERDHLRMGRILAGTANKVFETLRFTDDVTLDWQVRHLSIPLREIDPAKLAAAQERLAKDPAPVWVSDTAVDHTWMYAAALLDFHRYRRQHDTFDYVIRVLRIGDAAIVGVPGEPFVEGQLKIKLGSPTFPTYLAHNCYYAAYIPTLQAFQRGGYGEEPGLISKLVPEALDTIAEAAIDMLNEMFSPAEQPKE
ncbi:MAG: hypothetical protein ACYC7E_19505 [Armatimonadota bacterium]